MATYNIEYFGAVGDGVSDDAPGIQNAIDACHENGGGRVIVPSGKTFLAGPFSFKSNVELHLEGNARILANPDKSVYTTSAFKYNKTEGTIWIGGENADNISITGTGSIDGDATKFMDGEDPAAFRLPECDDVDIRPHLLTWIGCNNVTIRDVTFKNATYWCLHLVGCVDVLINGVRILNNLKIRNCDGIDPDHCKNVRISDCYIESGDDCICLKNRREYEEFGDCENITVTGCILKSTSCAIKIGSENVNTIRNVVMDSCIIYSSNRGIGIQNRDEGNVENLIFSNMIIQSRLFDDVWWGKAEPIYITSFNRNDVKRRFSPDGIQKNVGKVKNIKFNNIFCEGESGVFIAGSDNNVPENISLTDVKIRIDKTTKYKGGVYDRRPCDVEGIIEYPIAGIYVNRAKNVSIKYCSLEWGENVGESFGSAIDAENVEVFEVIDFKGVSSCKEKFPDRRLVNIK
ncbi:MAG: hypothetical protein K9J12_18050 [Melioribacteraceae bacterium]|nr:hypothetical protein [Melioribacteraceae bacterium]MCF8265790.1 hypothetical protein [Melioribacteraceae bacterium]